MERMRKKGEISSKEEKKDKKLKKTKKQKEEERQREEENMRRAMDRWKKYELKDNPLPQEGK